MSDTNVAEYDKNMRPMQTGEAILAWHSPQSAPFKLEGFGFYDRDRIYRRLPVDPPEPIPEAVDQFANHTTGGQIRFRSDSMHVALHVILPGVGGMVHMAQTGQNGFDLYIGEPTKERFYNCAKYELKDKSYEVLLFEQPERLMREYTLYFPLYNGVTEVLVGLDPEAKIERPGSRAREGRVVVYGTSITQGGCASRPGTCYTNILARRLNMEFVNLGFSGSGQGEPEVARAVVEVENPCMFVMDYEANCNDLERLRRTLPEFVAILRNRYPELPILVLPRINHAKESFEPEFLKHARIRRKIQSDFVVERRAAGDAHIRFFDASQVLGDDFDECTVDGSHPTDLGFMRMARGFEPVFREMLEL